MPQVCLVLREKAPYKFKCGKIARLLLSDCSILLVQPRSTEVIIRGLYPRPNIETSLSVFRIMLLFLSKPCMINIWIIVTLTVLTCYVFCEKEIEINPRR